MLRRNKSDGGGPLKVRFLPNGGFNKNGAFVEYEGDHPPEKAVCFERASYLTLNIECFDMELIHGASIFNDSLPENVSVPLNWRTIRAKGRVLCSNYGQYSLSMMGSRSFTTELAVSVREGEDAEDVLLSGYNEHGEFGEIGPETFFVEAVLKAERFERLLDAIQQPKARLRLSVRANEQRGFYAPWSPSIDEGRLLKFLDGKYDAERLVENANEIPELFWRRPEDRWSKHRPQAEVAVVQPIGPQTDAATAN